MNYTRVSAFAPATVANVGSAFDVLGFAVEEPGDTVIATRTDTGQVRITQISGDNGRLSTNAAQNTAGVSSICLLEELRRTRPGEFDNVGIDLELIKGLPIGSGLGSSSASTAAAALAVNVLLGELLPRIALLPFAMEGERVACGAAHADNVGPSLLGGFVLIRSYDPLDIIQLPSPANAWISVVTPNVEVRTEDARKILHRSVSLADAVSQWGNVAALVAGIFQNDVALMGRSLEDKVIEPARAPLIPGFYEAKKAALTAGAKGCSISGSGPSMFALSKNQATAVAAAKQMVAQFESIQIEAVSHVSRVNSDGARVLLRE